MNAAWSPMRGHHVEAEDVRPERERPVEVGHLEVDVTDLDARIDRSRRRRLELFLHGGIIAASRSYRSWTSPSRTTSVSGRPSRALAAASNESGRRSRRPKCWRRRSQARSPASAQRTKASQWTPITSVWMPSARTAASEAPSQGSRRQQPPQQREVPRDEDEHAEQPELDAELGVGRLAGLDLGARPLRGHAGVAEPVALRVADDGLDPVAEVVAGGCRCDDSPG